MAKETSFSKHEKVNNLSNDYSNAGYHEHKQPTVVLMLAGSFESKQKEVTVLVTNPSVAGGKTAVLEKDVAKIWFLVFPSVGKTVLDLICYEDIN